MTHPTDEELDALEPAPHVSETPKSERDSADVLTAMPAPATLAERYDLRAKLDEAAAVLESWVELAAHCSIEEGVCCCGDDMKNHSAPMDCGHSPTDHGEYIAEKLVETTCATIAKIKGADHE